MSRVANVTKSGPPRGRGGGGSKGTFCAGRHESRGAKTKGYPAEHKSHGGAWGCRLAPHAFCPGRRKGSARPLT
jgi:hypothetical protein